MRRHFEWCCTSWFKLQIFFFDFNGEAFCGDREFDGPEQSLCREAAVGWLGPVAVEVHADETEGAAAALALPGPGDGFFAAVDGGGYERQDRRFAGREIEPIVKLVVDLERLDAGDDWVFGVGETDIEIGDGVF